MFRVSNALIMLKCLSSGKKYSIKELADLLEVSPRMIRIYKEDLEKRELVFGKEEVVKQLFITKDMYFKKNICKVKYSTKLIQFMMLWELII